MKVSVGILTYNQEHFIGQAIEGVLAQKTNFPFEILVGDDCSTDGTREVILQYQKQYPDIVKPVFHSKNLGQNGLHNTIQTLKDVKGEYIAIHDGDDYWIDPLKLQKQVDFLDQNPNFTTCFTNAYIRYDDGSPEEILNPPTQKAVITVDDLVGEDEIWFMATSAVIFRRSCWQIPDWFLKSSSGDIPRHIILAKQGPIGYLPDITSVYRKHKGGVSLADNYVDIGFLKNRIEMYEGINGELDFKYDKPLKKNIARYYKMMLEAKQYQNTYFARVPIALKYLKLGQPDSETKKEIIKTYIIPKWMMSFYSFIAILLFQIKSKISA